MSEYVYNDKYFECIDSDEKAYWLFSLSEFLLPLGINFKMARKSNTGKAKEIRLTRKNEIKKLFDFMYKNGTVKLDRKYNKFLTAFNNYEDLKMAS